MLKRLLLVGFVTTLGVGGVATPSFANTSGSVDNCDSLSPGCTFLVVQTPVSGPMLDTASFCFAPGAVPTVNDGCVYVEVDSPTVP